MDLCAMAANPECNVIVSDDGLQHYRLARDAEIAVFEGARGFGNGWMLPAGPLREPASRLGEVDAVVVRCAESHEVFWGMAAVFGAKLHVVHVNKHGVTATGNATFPTVTVKDRTSDLWGDALRCAERSSAHVGACVCVAVRADGFACPQVGACACVVVCAHVGASVWVVVCADGSVCSHVGARVCVALRGDGFVCVHVFASVGVVVCANACVIACAHLGACAHLFGSTCAHVGVHVPDVLPVALRHGEDFGTDLDALTATLLFCPAAALTNRERDLVT